MSIIKGLEWTFITEAEKYKKMRPGYVSELYEDIFKYIPIDKSKKIIHCEMSYLLWMKSLH